VATSTASLHRTEVDGVSCVWSESKGDDLVAGLIFRVGVADESMRINGVSHLVEHLALPSSPVSGVEHNGTVDMLTTLFWAGGRPEPALDLIAQVAASLADPLLAQLPLERSIVRAEAAQRPWTNWHNALALRFGPVAHGLGMYEEYGVTAATDERVAGWAATRFTKGNAILYLTGPPPDDLVLPLQTGGRRPPPPPRPIPYIDYPSAYPLGPEGCVVVSLVTEVSAAAMTAIDIGVRRLRHRLRVESGTTYHVSWVTEAVDRDRVHVLITADCLPTEIDATRGLVIATLDDLAFDGPTAEELAEAAVDFARFVRDPDRLAHNVHYAALDELLGRPLMTFDESIDARERLTADEVAAALEPALASMLLMLPHEATLPAGRFTEYPLSSPNLPKPRRLFQRRERKPWHRGPKELLLVGDEGVARARHGQIWAVSYAECVAGLRWENGGRELWSADGFLVAVSPEEWKHGAAAVRAIDESAPPKIWITMDTAEPSGIGVPDGALAEIEVGARIQLLRVEVDRQPEDGRLWDQLAAALIDSGDWSSAVDAADRASALDSTDAWARRMKGRALVEAGRDAEAVEAIADALRIDAAGLPTLLDAAHVLCEADEAERAIRYVDRAVELYPGERDAWFARGRVFESLGERERSEEAYSRAAELEPEQTPWHSNLAGVLAKRRSRGPW
jgi:hypothetical protein